VYIQKLLSEFAGFCWQHSAEHNAHHIITF